MATKRKASKSKSSGKPKAVDFKSLTPTQRRVAIAEDVIAALRAKRYTAEQSNGYVTTKVSANNLVSKADLASLNDGVEVEIDLQSALAKNMKSCTVCAKGAMFVAAVEKFDRLKVTVGDQNDDVLEQFNDDDAVCDHLENYFSREQLDLIEEVFEETNYSQYVCDKSDLARATIIINNPDATSRMIAIMENIVANKGKLVF